MSLKHFHVVFIVLAILCTLGFALWALFLAEDGAGVGVRILGGVSALIGVGLIAYGAWFLKKSKNIIT